MVAIKNMEMPKSCFQCDFYSTEYGCKLKFTEECNPSVEKPDDCPLVELGICKNCKHWDKSEEHCLRLSSDNGWFEDEYYQVYTESDFYCKYFEKRGTKNG